MNNNRNMTKIFEESLSWDKLLTTINEKQLKLDIIKFDNVKEAKDDTLNRFVLIKVGEIGYNIFHRVNLQHQPDENPEFIQRYNIKNNQTLAIVFNKDAANANTITYTISIDDQTLFNGVQEKTDVLKIIVQQNEVVQQ